VHKDISHNLPETAGLAPCKRLPLYSNTQQPEQLLV